jgi:hypothetical protein
VYDGSSASARVVRVRPNTGRIDLGVFPLDEHQLDDVLEIAPGRQLTFEYIGEVDFFGEGDGRPRRRGTRCTSVDAAFLQRSNGWGRPAGKTRLARR